MKPSRIAMATVGVGAALTAGVWTLSAAAVPLPADPIAIPVARKRAQPLDGISQLVGAQHKTSPR